MTVIVVHYSEIGVKGGNRSYFERMLVQNVQKSVKPLVSKVYKLPGRIICELNENADLNSAKKILALIPGIANFSFAEQAELDLEKIRKKASEMLKNVEFESFKVETQRSNKTFKYKSPEISAKVGEEIHEGLNKKVDVNNPALTFYIEICDKEAYLYHKKISAVGGLPVGVSGKLMCSLSGGIDSPVAAYMMMKRGCKIVFVHIYNNSQTSEGVVTKIHDLTKQLTNIQLGAKLYIVPFAEIQRRIIMDVPAKFRMIIYRRFMMKIINAIAKKEGAKGLVTGDSVGQVASQTLENMECIRAASNIPVYSPLIGLNKEEIVTISKNIDTYELSVLPYPDCCSYMIADHPETKADLEKIKKIEESIQDQEQIINECIEKSEIKKCDY